MPARFVNPEWHFVVPDVDLRERVIDRIKSLHLPNSAREEPDAVLIMAERA